MIGSYFKWHYSEAFRELTNIFKNYLSFSAHFFSLRLLWKTIFEPWHRFGEKYPRGFNIESFFSALIINLMMRILGFVSRFVIIIVGLLACLLCLVSFLITIVLWFFSPLIIATLFASGVILILSAL